MHWIFIILIGIAILASFAMGNNIGKKRSVFLLVLSFSGMLAQGQSRNKDYLLPFEKTDSVGITLKGFKTPVGEIVIPAKYINVYTDTLYHMAIVLAIDLGIVCIDRNDSILCRPFIFDNGPDYVLEGVFRIVENEKMGFADTDGNIVIPPIFDFVSPFGERYDEYKEEGFASYVMGGYRQYTPGGEYYTWVGGYENGYINHAGQRFAKVGKLKNGKRKAWTTDGRRVWLDRDGNIVKENK